MIIVKKIKNPNIFFTFSKKYYWLHIYHSISADLPGFWLKNAKTPQLVPKNGIFWSTDFRKIPFLPLFLYIFCTKMAQMAQMAHILLYMKKFIKIYRVEWKKHKKIYTYNIYSAPFAPFAPFWALKNFNNYP